MSAPVRPDPLERIAEATARRERRQARARWARFAVLATAVLLLDQTAKVIVRATLEPGEEVDVLPGFSITRVTNQGIAFGLFPGRQTIVAVLTVVALSAIAIALAGLVGRHPAVAAGGGLLMGGSVGNLIDRIVHDGVTDFLDPHRWPAFNIADVGIVAGAALIALGLLRSGEDGEDAENFPWTAR